MFSALLMAGKLQSAGACQHFLLPHFYMSVSRVVTWLGKTAKVPLQVALRMALPGKSASFLAEDLCGEHSNAPQPHSRKSSPQEGLNLLWDATEIAEEGLQHCSPAKTGSGQGRGSWPVLQSSQMQKCSRAALTVNGDVWVPVAGRGSQHGSLQRLQALLQKLF